MKIINHNLLWQNPDGRYNLFGIIYNEIKSEKEKEAEISLLINHQIGITAQTALVTLPERRQRVQA